MIFTRRHALGLVAGVVLSITAGNALAADPLKVASYPANPPWENKTEAGTFEGFEVDIANDIAKRLGVTIQQVQNLLILASAPPEIRQMVASEEVSASTAIDAIRRFGGTAVAKLTAAVSHARSEGKGKATGKHLVDPVHRSAKRQAPALWNVAKVIQSDPGFSALSQVVQAQLVELLKSIETAGQKKSQSRKADRGAQKTSNNSQQNLDLP